MCFRPRRVSRPQLRAAWLELSRFRMQELPARYHLLLRGGCERQVGEAPFAHAHCRPFGGKASALKHREPNADGQPAPALRDHAIAS